jgi:hypothetical protein
VGQLIHGDFGEGDPSARREGGAVSPEIADAVDAFVTFRILRKEFRTETLPEEEFQAAAADLWELAVEQRVLLDELSPVDRCRAINLGRAQLNAERMGFFEPPAVPDTAEAV